MEVYNIPSPVLVVRAHFQEYWQQIITAARAFIAMGLKPRHGVCIVGFNTPEWLIADLAAIFAG